MNLILPMTVFLGLFGTSLHAWTAESAPQLLKKIGEKTRPVSVSVKSLPQNLGGQAPKLSLDQAPQLSQRALDLAMSDEAVFQGVIKDVIHPLRRMLESKKMELSKLMKENSKFVFMEINAEPTEKFDGISRWLWTTKKTESGISDFEKDFSKFLNHYTEVEFAEISAQSFESLLSDRDAKTSQPNKFSAVLKFDIRGLGADQSRRHDRLSAVLNVVKVPGQNSWKAEGLKFERGETLTASTKIFEEKKLFSGASPSLFLRREAIRRGGYALSVADWNNDGNPDLVVGHLGEVELFTGDKNSNLKKVSNKELGIESETLVKSAVVNDFDNDGVKDLLLVRFAPNEQQGKDISIYRGLGNKFEKVSSIKNRYPAYYAMPSAVADYNGDGLLDFYVGFPGAKDFTVLNKKAHGFVGLKEPHPQGLFYNFGKMNFTEVTKEKMVYSLKRNAYTDGYPESAVIFPHTSTGLDYDLDGDMDIVVIDDKANLSPLYKNDGQGLFTQVAEKVGLINSDFGMGFTAADLDGDGKLEFIYSNVNFTPASRVSQSLARNFSEYGHRPGTIGLKIFKTTDGLNYSDITSLSGISDVGEGVAGVEVIDYNNDGHLDIYVANGLWSGSSREEDLSSLFVRAHAKFDYDFQEVMGSAAGIEQANTSFMKILTGFQGEVESTTAKKNIYPSMAGFQRNRLFRNNGNGTFTEIGYLAGVDSLADGYIVATADLNKDGRMDLILRNGDPGTEAHKFPPVQSFTNEFAGGNNSVILSFEGTASNRDAVGLVAEAKIGSRKMVRHLTANNGSVQSEAVLHFGLAEAKKIDELVLRWPSGLKESHKNLPPGRHHFKEPPSGFKSVSN